MTIVATLWQFMSRSDMTRDNMSQALGAWGLRLEALDQYQWTPLSYSVGIILVSPIFYLPY